MGIVELLHKLKELYESSQYRTSLRLSFLLKSDSIIVPAFKSSAPLSIAMVEIPNPSFFLDMEISKPTESYPSLMRLEYSIIDVIGESAKIVDYYPELYTFEISDYALMKKSELVFSYKYYEVEEGRSLDEISFVDRAREEIFTSEEPLKVAYEIYYYFFEILKGKRKFENIAISLRELGFIQTILGSLLFLRYNPDFTNWLIGLLKELTEKLIPYSKLIHQMEIISSTLRALSLLL